MLSVPNAAKIHDIPSMNPMSPIRFTRNAFFPASAANPFSKSNPISRYEHSPTPSHPTNITAKLDPSTSTSIIAMNRFRNAKYR